MSDAKAVMREMLLAQISKGTRLAADGEALLKLATDDNWGEELTETVRYHLASVYKNLDLYAAELRRLDESTEAVKL